MQLDRTEGQPDGKVAWGSDIAAQMLRRFGIPYVSLNPGASYRGLHDSLVNHLGNERARHPALPARGSFGRDRARLCQGDRRADGLRAAQQCRAAARHDEPVQRLVRPRADDRARRHRAARRREAPARGSTGFTPRAIRARSSARSSNGTTSRPRPQALVESMCRANHRDAHGADRAGLYLPRRRPAGSSASTRSRNGRIWRASSRRRRRARRKSAVDAGRRAARRCRASGDPVRPRLARRRQAWQARIRLAERLGACVMTDLKPARCSRPTIRRIPCRRSTCSAQAGARAVCARPTSSWRSTGSISAARCGRPSRSARCRRKIISATLDQNLHTGANMEYQSLPAVDVSMAATPTRWSTDLLAALGRRHSKDAVEANAPPAKPQSQRDGACASRWSMSPSALRAEFNDPENVTLLHARPRLADRHLAVPERHRLSRQGRRRRARLGPGAFGRLGARAARASAAMRSRCSATAISAWARPRSGPRCVTAFRCSILINNNRSYFNDELHQETVARTRGREVEEPLDRPAHGRSRARHRQARRGAGRGRHRPGRRRAADVKAAISKGVAVLKSGGVCVIDFHVEPPADRSDGIGHRPTGG